jgi:hypothetical protein
MTSPHPRKRPARDAATRELESRICRRCGAQPSQQCVTASGSGAPMSHAERRNDSRRAAGIADLEHEGMFQDRFPPRASR